MARNHLVPVTGLRAGKIISSAGGLMEADEKKADLTGMSNYEH